MANQSSSCSYDGDDTHDDLPNSTIIPMLQTFIRPLIDDALAMMRVDNSLCTDEVQTLLNYMVEQDISVDPINQFLSEISK
jgi:hypothetical protein